MELNILRSQFTQKYIPFLYSGEIQKTTNMTFTLVALVNFLGLFAYAVIAHINSLLAKDEEEKVELKPEESLKWHNFKKKCKNLKQNITPFAFFYLLMSMLQVHVNYFLSQYGFYIALSKGLIMTTLALVLASSTSLIFTSAKLKAGLARIYLKHEYFNLTFRLIFHSLLSLIIAFLIKKFKIISLGL